MSMTSRQVDRCQQTVILSCNYLKNEKIDARRAELLNEKKEKKAAHAEDTDEEEEEDVEEMLMAEFEVVHCRC